MGVILEEFDFLIEEEIETTFEEDSENLINEVKQFKEKSKQYPNATYQGISVTDLCKCIDFGETEIVPWEHTYFTIDFSILKDITDSKLEELSIPSFIEEVRSTGNSELGYNQSLRNNIKYIKIPKNLIVISPNTFAFYKKLESIKFEKESKLIHIGSNAFASCEHLRTLDLRNCLDLDKLPDNLISQSSVEVLKFSDKIQNFTANTFNNTKLKTVVINKVKYDFSEFIQLLQANKYKPFW